MDSYESIYEEFIKDFGNKNIQNQGYEWQTSIDPDDIFNSPDAENSDQFWSQHGETLFRYKDLIINYQKAKEEAEKYGNLDHLSLDHPLRAAYFAFHGSEPIKLINYNDKLLIDGNGRHRIEAAKILRAEGYDVKLTALVAKWGDAKAQKEKSKMGKLSFDKIIRDNLEKGPENSKNFEQPVLTHSHKTSSNIMAHQIENQIELLDHAKAVFLQHSQVLNDLQEMYNNAVKSFEQDGLNHDYQSFIEEFQEIYNSKLRELVSTIEDEYIPIINRKIQYLEERV